MKRPPFVHLHNHTTYSALDGLQDLDRMCAAAAADGQPAIAITDHGTLAGTWKFQAAAERHEIKPIMGIEVYLAFGSRFDRVLGEGASDDQISSGGEPGSSDGKARRYLHLTLFAENARGWRNLVELDNAAWGGHWSKPRVDWDLLAEHSEGIVALTGCMGGPLMSPLLLGDVAAATANLSRLVEIYGRGSVGVEVMEHGIEGERKALPELVRLAKWAKLPLVATNDAHYTHPEDAGTHDAWLCSGQKCTIDTPDRWRFRGTGYHLRTTAEMRAIFDDQPGTEGAVTAAYEIAERVAGRVLPEKKRRLPKYRRPDGTEVDSVKELRSLVVAGAKERFGSPLPQEVKERLRYELSVIEEAGFPDYFLIVADEVNWAKQAGILTGVGRGSAAGCLVAYCAGITGIDSLRHGLWFERFLNPDRVEMPDIDTDFERGRRDEVIAYLIERWGADRAARIGTMMVDLSRGAIERAGRALGQASAARQLSEAITNGEGNKPHSLAEMEEIEEGQAFRELAAKAPEVVSLAHGFEGAVNGLSIHASGVVVSPHPLLAGIPLRPMEVGSPIPVTEWDGHDIEEVGLLKLDILAVRNLDVIAETARLIEAATGEHVSPNDFEFEGTERAERTWRMLAEGRTAGIFQLDSGGMMRLCEQIQPSNIDELAAVLALFRPGPLGQGLHNVYARRKAGIDKLSYDNFTTVPEEVAVISEILDETYGVPVYQEQIMALARYVAGFTPGETDRVRSVVSKKKQDQIAEFGEQFLAGAQSGTDHAGEPKVAFRPETAKALWAAIKSAGSYAFNKSHSVGYAYTSYQTAYLKANWPEHYGAALLSRTDRADKRFVVLRWLAEDGIKVATPDVNEGMAWTTARDGVVRLGLAEIKDVGSNAERIVAEREENGPYKSLADLVARAGIPAGAVAALIEAGACDAFGPRLGQVMVARAVKDVPDLPVPQAEWGVEERAIRERNRLGTAVSVSPLRQLHPQLRKWLSGTGQRVVPLHRAESGRVSTIGLLTRFEVVKKGKRRANVSLEGTLDSIDGVVWSDTLDRLERTGGFPEVGSIVGVDARVRVRTVIRRADEDDPDAGDEIEERKELTVQDIWRGALDDPATDNIIRLPVPAFAADALPEPESDGDSDSEPEPGPEPASDQIPEPEQKKPSRKPAASGRISMRWEGSLFD